MEDFRGNKVEVGRPLFAITDNGFGPHLMVVVVDAIDEQEGRVACHQGVIEHPEVLKAHKRGYGWKLMDAYAPCGDM